MTLPPKPGHCLFLALTGGVASGKSTVSSMFAELGATCIHADRLAQEELDREPSKSEVAALLGREVVNGFGGIDRARVAAVVFQDPEKLKALEAILHPRVQARALAMIREIPPAGKRPAVVILDIPLLEKSPFAAWCDKKIFVETQSPLRVKRAMQERGWDAGEVLRRERAQRQVDEKRAEADFVIDNSGSLLQTRVQVQRIWDTVTQREPA